MDTLKTILTIALAARIYKKRRLCRMYMRKVLENRVTHGEMFLVEEMEKDDEYFTKYFRMKNLFDLLLTKIVNKITHGKNHRLPISPKQRLAITLRYISSGDEQNSLAFSYRISPASASIIIKETLVAIWDTLKEDYMPMPSQDDWKQVSDEFWGRWQFPNCVGAIDGKHIRIRCPPNTGTLHYNYKGYYSNVLLALVDANYKFLMVDVGAPGSLSDGGILQNSNFGRALVANLLPLPTEKSLPGTTIPSPFVFLGDSGFPLKNHLMRPFPITTIIAKEKIFNYRLSRARRISENAFGIMAARFRIFHATICASPKLVNIITKAAAVLHNFLSTEEGILNFTADSDGEFEPGERGNWRDDEDNNQSVGLEEFEEIYAASNDAVRVREVFSDYFVSAVGSLPWQATRATRTASVF